MSVLLQLALVGALVLDPVTPMVTSAADLSCNFDTSCERWVNDHDSFKIGVPPPGPDFPNDAGSSMHAYAGGNLLSGQWSAKLMSETIPCLTDQSYLMFRARTVVPMFSFISGIFASPKIKVGRKSGLFMYDLLYEGEVVPNGIWNIFLVTLPVYDSHFELIIEASSSTGLYVVSIDDISIKGSLPQGDEACNSKFGKKPGTLPAFYKAKRRRKQPTGQATVTQITPAPNSMVPRHPLNEIRTEKSFEKPMDMGRNRTITGPFGFPVSGDMVPRYKPSFVTGKPEIDENSENSINRVPFGFKITKLSSGSEEKLGKSKKSGKSRKRIESDPKTEVANPLSKLRHLERMFSLPNSPEEDYYYYEGEDDEEINKVDKIDPDPLDLLPQPSQDLSKLIPFSTGSHQISENRIKPVLDSNRINPEPFRPRKLVRVSGPEIRKTSPIDCDFNQNGCGFTASVLDEELQSWVLVTTGKLNSGHVETNRPSKSVFSHHALRSPRFSLRRATKFSFSYLLSNDSADLKICDNEGDGCIWQTDHFSIGSWVTDVFTLGEGMHQVYFLAETTQGTFVALDDIFELS